MSEMTELERRCVESAYAADCACDGGDSDEAYLAIVRAVLAEAGVAEMREALVEHNDLLRSAFAAAQRDAIADTRGTTAYNLLADNCHKVLKKHHAITNAARTATARAKP